jgi:hypothetical protein
MGMLSGHQFGLKIVGTVGDGNSTNSVSALMPRRSNAIFFELPKKPFEILKRDPTDIRPAVWMPSNLSSPKS